MIAYVIMNNDSVQGVCLGDENDKSQLSKAERVMKKLAKIKIDLLRKQGYSPSCLNEVPLYYHIHIAKVY